MVRTNLGDINRLNKLVDSQARDLKRTIRDAALTQSEFEKALMMKNGECEVFDNFMLKLLLVLTN